MGDVLEVLITSDVSSNPGSACVWDYKAGTNLHCYKNGGCLASRSIAFIGDSYIIAAERSKPLLHIWQLNSQEPNKQSRVVTPGPVSALAVSPDGNYCVAGIAEQIYVWQVTTGHLLTIVSKHFQSIVKILFSSDGSRFVSAAEDGVVIVWLLSDLVSQLPDHQEPLYVLSEHTLPVRDLYLSSSSRNDNLISVSADHTLKVHQFDSGELLLSVVYDTGLTAVTSNAAGSLVFVGTSNGNIYELNLLNPPRNRSYHVDSNNSVVYSGHMLMVTSLSLSIDGLTLASASSDNQIILWHVPTKQKLRTIPQNDSITNVFFTTAITNMFLEDFKPIKIFKSFQREVMRDDSVSRTVEVMHSEDLKLPFEDALDILPCEVGDSDNVQKEIEKLKHINAQLYQFSLNYIMNDDSKTEEEGLVQPKKRKRQKEA